MYVYVYNKQRKVQPAVHSGSILSIPLCMYLTRRAVQNKRKRVSEIVAPASQLKQTTASRTKAIRYVTLARSRWMKCKKCRPPDVCLRNSDAYVGHEVIADLQSKHCPTTVNNSANRLLTFLKRIRGSWEHKTRIYLLEAQWRREETCKMVDGCVEKAATLENWFECVWGMCVLKEVNTAVHFARRKQTERGKEENFEWTVWSPVKNKKKIYVAAPQ